MRELALFTGAGGGILGGHILGWRTICAVEVDPYCRSVLLARQRDGALERFPIWDDIRTFDGSQWRGHVDVVSGGFPCTDISVAGKQAGIEGAQSGLWAEMARVIREVRPRYVFVENSPNLVRRGLALVLGDLAALGYDAQWGVLGAVDAGAPHKRERIWIVADRACDGRRQGRPGGSTSSSAREQQQPLLPGVPDAERGVLRDEPRGRGGAYGPGASVAVHDGAQESVADAGGAGWKRACWELPPHEDTPRRDNACDSGAASWWGAEPHVGGVADGLAPGLDQHGACASEENIGRVGEGIPDRPKRLKAIGNGQVPAVAALAWQILSRRLP